MRTDSGGDSQWHKKRQTFTSVRTQQQKAGLAQPVYLLTHVLRGDCWLTNPFHLRLSLRKHTQNKALRNKQRNQSIMPLSVQHEMYLQKHRHCGALRLRRPFHSANRLTGRRWMMSKTDVRNTQARRYLQVTHRCATLPVR